MLTLNLNSEIEQQLNALASLKNESIERIITDALKLYTEKQEDLECLATIEAREHEHTLSHDDVIQRLKADGFIIEAISLKDLKAR
jgi:predicted transcriptional regulator